MKHTIRCSSHRVSTAFAAAFALAILLCAPVGAQTTNLLKNFSFEDPIDPPGADGTTNWTTVYAYGGPADFAYAGRNTEGCKSTDETFPGGSFGAAFRAIHDGLAHAYHKQVVTNLVPGANYLLTGYLHKDPKFNNDKYVPYIVLIGSLGMVSNIATTTREQYSLLNKATANGTIEVRVGMYKDTFVSTVGDCKFSKAQGWMDVMCLTRVP